MIARYDMDSDIASDQFVPTQCRIQREIRKRRWDLSPEQQQIVNKELDDYAKYYQNIEEERANVARFGKERIFKVLTPEQQKRFNDIFEHLPH